MNAIAHQERLMTVLKGPHLSEKSHLATERGQYVFKVRRDATKKEIKQAVELLFEVPVLDVTTMNYAGKSKRYGMSRGRRSAWKKAYVRLAEGSHIEFLEAD